LDADRSLPSLARRLGTGDAVLLGPRLVLHCCTVGQGYLFAPPMTPGDAAAFLRNLTQAEAVVGG
jgi:hypothetical protein